MITTRKRILTPFLALTLLVGALSHLAPAASAAGDGEAGRVIKGAPIIAEGTMTLDEETRAHHRDNKINDGIVILDDYQFFVMDTLQLIKIAAGLKIDARRAGYRFSDELCPVQDTATGKYGYVDKSGKLAIPCEHSGVQAFSEGLAAVSKDGKWGYIDTSGKTVIDYRFSTAFYFGEGFAFVVDSELGEGCIDKSGNIVIPFGKYRLGSAAGFNMYGFSDGRAIYMDNAGIGYIDAKGEIVIPAQYGFSPNIPVGFSEGLAVAEKKIGNDYKYGYIDTAGNTVIDFQYDKAFAFRGGVAFVSLFNDGVRCIDRQGNIIFIYSGIPGYMPNTTNTTNDLYCYDGLIRTGGVSWPINGYRSTSGAMVVSCNYSGYFDSTQFSDGKAFAYWRDGTGTFYHWAVIQNPLYTDYSSMAAKPTQSKVYVDGREIAFDSYLINDNNYFKLRDLAYTLSGGAAQFGVRWEEKINSIALTKGAAYTAVGGEMAGKGTGDKPLNIASSRIFAKLAPDSDWFNEIYLAGYNIEGNNYFKLRDIGELFDFNVFWDAAANSVIINTSEGYTPD